jgi:hypothetical protein
VVELLGVFKFRSATAPGRSDAETIKARQRLKAAVFKHGTAALQHRIKLILKTYLKNYFMNCRD